MKHTTIYWTAMALFIMGVAACDSGITGPDIPTPPGFEEAEAAADPAIAAAKHRKARMGRNPRTGQTIQ